MPRTSPASYLLSALPILLILTVAAWWFATASDRRWEEFKTENHCVLEGIVQPKSMAVDKPVRNEDGTTDTKKETARFLGVEYWECNGGTYQHPLP